MRRFYQKLSNPNENRLNLFPMGLCYSFHDGEGVINGNPHQFTPRRFYPFSRGIDTRGVSQKKKPSNNHSKVIEQKNKRGRELSNCIQRLQINRYAL